MSIFVVGHQRMILTGVLLIALAISGLADLGMFITRGLGFKILILQRKEGHSENLKKKGKDLSRP